MIFQVRYYNGEESSHDLGYGIAPGNLSSSQDEARKKYEKNKIEENKYLFKGVLIELLDEPSIRMKNGNWGNLCMRLVSESKKDMKKIAKGLFLPFEKEGISTMNLRGEH